jgi:hypothetical protein
MELSVDITTKITRDAMLGDLVTSDHFDALDIFRAMPSVFGALDRD